MAILPINPDALVQPVGYSHAIAASGKVIYLAGQVAFDQAGTIVCGGDLVGQFDRALANLREVMTAAGGSMTDIVKLNLFVKDKEDYKRNLKPIGVAYRTYFGKHFPAMTLVEVSSLFEDDALIEIEGIAVID